MLEGEQFQKIETNQYSKKSSGTAVIGENLKETGERIYVYKNVIPKVPVKKIFQ